MIRETAIVGCVLAGGKSTRMGSDKALLKVGGVTLIERSVTLLTEMFPSVVISSDRGAEFEFLGIPVLPDIRKDCGPLGGIHAVLTQTHADSLFVLACDMPFVSSDLIHYIIDMHADRDATIPSLGGGVHPLCGVYSRTGLPMIEKFLDVGEYKLRHVLEKLNSAIIPLSRNLPFYSSHLFDNINCPDDLLRAQRARID